MTLLKARIVRLTGGATFNGSSREIVNDTTIHEQTHTSATDTAHDEASQPEIIKYTFKFTIDSITFGLCNAYAGIHDDTDTIVHASKQWTSIGPGSYEITLYYQWRDRQGGAPTYLEELHKLDRNSSSHYIPR